MRTMRLAAPLLVLVLVLAACTPTSRPDAAPRAGDVTRSDPSDVVVMGMSGGIGAVDATSGRILSLTHGAVPEPDWSHVYTTATSGGNTRVERVTTDTGEVVSSMKVRGDLRIRAVAPSGRGVALMPARDAEDAWIPHARTRTTIVVAEMDGVSQA